MGVFALRDGRVIEKNLFPKNPVEIADRLTALERSFCKEEVDLIHRLYETGNMVLGVRNPRRFRELDTRGMEGLKFVKEGGIVDDMDIVSQIGFKRNKFMTLLSQVNLEITKRRVRQVEKDQLIIQAVNSIDDLEESANKLSKRLREFYSYCFPEMDHLVKSDETYVSLVEGGLEKVDKIHPSMADGIRKSKKETLGVDFSKGDYMAVKALAKSILKLNETTSDIESYIGDSMKDMAPNLNALAGPLLGARLISLAGSLKRLAMMPASTVQVLGAEDAFFRFLKTGKKPPKHGIIFTLPEIRGASMRKRGRISRKFAAKLAISAKADYFKGEFIGDQLRKDFLKKIKGV
ncbi:MAG: hypothetical protein U9M95_00045 [Candidatus Altiarchaeota archaeon]|nr:hypothetical protein [Candidatus Altiarchaeota archaeon]